MIDVNSNCSRVDTAKARAAQLRMQLDQMSRRKAEKPDDFHKAQSRVQSLDAAVKKGDAKQAETALSTATSAVRELQSDSQTSPTFRRGLDVYA